MSRLLSLVSHFPSFVRLGLLAAAVALIRHHAPAPVAEILTVERVRDYYPKAAALSEPNGSGLQTVKDASGITLGHIAQTAPESDEVIGYSGPTNSLLALDTNGRILGLRILHSEDTPEHLAEVVAHRPFFQQFKTLKLGAVDPAFVPTTVTGATLTSNAIATGILRKLGSPSTSLRFPEAIALAEVQELLPAAMMLEGEKVMDGSGKVIARAIRTSPASDSTIGYKGPSDTLLLLDASGDKVLHVKLRSSFDTETYVGYVTGDAHFLKLFAQKSIRELAEIDFDKAGVEGISGATETSYGVAQGLKLRAQTYVAAQTPAWRRVMDSIRWRWQDTGHVVILVSALVMAFTRLRGKAMARQIHHGLLVIYGGFIVGELLSQALFVGWARGAAAWQSAPGLVLVAVVALLGPVFTGKQLYCHHICPHGALQQLVARRLPWQWHPGPRMLKVLRLLPFVLLAGIVCISVLGMRVNLNALEPFDAYLYRIAGIGSLVVFAVGFIASLFIPLAYCHHGCPTGAVFTLLRHRGSGDRLGRKEMVCAGVLLFLALTGCTSAGESQITGKAMGSSWSVRFARAMPHRAEMTVAAELERIEQIFSHYREDSEIGRFNRHRSTDPMRVSPEVVSLLTQLKATSEKMNGVLDPSLAPVFRLWRGTDQVSEASIAAAKSHAGWHKLRIITQPPALQKLDPELQLDLSCIVEGHALQRVDRLLQTLGSQRHLIHLSGEVFARGSGPGGELWRVGIQTPDPRATEGFVTTQVPLIDQCVTTAGTYRQRHIIDPRSGHPVEHNLRSVSVFGTDPVLADAQCTALLILGPELGRKRAEELQLNAVFLQTETPTPFP
jgi:thiamine biosynthesis lipoprotein ApbE/Na+-translocating ferredoxin:NAD+ oxidoreductase RnfG subunit